MITPTLSQSLLLLLSLFPAGAVLRYADERTKWRAGVRAEFLSEHSAGAWSCVHRLGCGMIADPHTCYAHHTPVNLIRTC